MSGTIKIFGSGSSGNSLAIYDSRGRYIVVDVGLPYKKILKGLCYDLSNCVSILCSHNHTSDHSKSLDYFIKMGVPCYGNQDVCDNHKGCNVLPKVLKVDGFIIQNFELVHNVPNNAFVIDTHDGIRILYCTDTQYIPKIVRGVHYAIIECNYDMDYMIDNAMVGEIRKSAYNYHQSIDNCIEYAKKIYHPNMQKIILWHLSDGNINEKNALTKTRYELSTNDIIIGDNGVEIDLKKNEFEIQSEPKGVNGYH